MANPYPLITCSCSISRRVSPPYCDCIQLWPQPTCAAQHNHVDSLPTPSPASLSRSNKEAHGILLFVEESPSVAGRHELFQSEMRGILATAGRTVYWIGRRLLYLDIVYYEMTVKSDWWFGDSLVEHFALLNFSPISIVRAFVSLGLRCCLKPVWPADDA